MRNNRIPYNGDICTAVASCNYIQFDRQKKHSAGSQELGGKSRNGYGSHLPYIKRSNILYDFLGGSHVGIYKGSAAVGSDGHCYCNLCGAEFKPLKIGGQRQKEAGKLYERGYVRGFVPRSLHSLGRRMGYGNRHLFRLMRGTSDRKSCKEAGLGHENYRNNMPMQAGA